MLIVGIDMAKNKFDVGLWINSKGESIGQYTNNAAGYDQLRSELSQKRNDSEMVKLIIEPTGGYEIDRKSVV